MDEEVFKASKAFIYERVRRAKLATDDAWFHDKELLNLYLLLNLYDLLSDIEDDLIYIKNKE